MDNYTKYMGELIKEIIKNRLDKLQIAKLKLKLCSKHNIKKPPTDFEILLYADEKLLPKLNILQTKPGRTSSGVSVVAVMTKPHRCPHGRCISCPGGVDSYYGDVPQSYTGKEPATMRGIRNNYDPYLQVFNRLEQYAVLGHNFEKIELIIMGGTFPSLSTKYQDNFVKGCFQAMNDFSRIFFIKGKFNIKKFKTFFELPAHVGDESRTKRLHKKILQIKKYGRLLNNDELHNKKINLKKLQKNSKKEQNISTTLSREQSMNEKSKIRCIALAIETRPDYCKAKHIKQMLKLGCTRVELGVQSIYDDVLDKLERGHSVDDSIEATRLMKCSLLKVGYHIMPGLPKSNYEKDKSMFKELFSNQNFKPDALKIYPCMVMPGTKLFDMYNKGKFKPINTLQAANLIAEIKQYVPKYCRIMRVQRDIPTFVTSAGVDKTNLRQYVSKIMEQKSIVCNCIRCREPRKREISWKDVRLNIMEYDASEGKEFFLSFDDMENNILLGFLRLRLLPDAVAGVRELHVYGQATSLGKKGNIQHKGLGKKLMKEAEKISKKNSCKKIKVISGIGVREYYRKLGYKKQDTYMVKKIRF